MEYFLTRFPSRAGMSCFKERIMLQEMPRWIDHTSFRLRWIFYRLILAEARSRCSTRFMEPPRRLEQLCWNSRKTLRAYSLFLSLLPGMLLRELKKGFSFCPSRILATRI